MPTRRILAAAVVLAMVACGPKPGADGTAVPAAQNTAPAAEREADVARPSAGFNIDTPSLRDCDGVEAIVSWDIAATHPAVSDVEIWVGPESAPTLFAAGGSSGSATTGPWTMPGTTFRLRDKATGKDIERFSVTGPACGG